MPEISALSALTSSLPISGVTPRVSSTEVSEAGSNFGELLGNLISQTSMLQDVSANAEAEFAAGGPIELHQVMASKEEALLALEFLTAVRDKFSEAYRTLVHMQ